MSDVDRMIDAVLNKPEATHVFITVEGDEGFRMHAGSQAECECIADVLEDSDWPGGRVISRQEFLKVMNEIVSHV